jgi:hypothetical protein
MLFLYIYFVRDPMIINIKNRYIYSTTANSDKVNLLVIRNDLNKPVQVH